ncbi:MAG TPA: YkgJ family cysteine cluster protein [Caulobacteraceae bacterium]|jgi:hypothetical protein|nr:YkgJ family cysteine cluster protein [Caulobacteraceae bacterium]
MGPRDEAFGYICRRCLNCCHDKHIQLNPYEVARLARHLRLSTTEFRATHTIDGAGVALARRDEEDGACVFLGPEGCEVHADRPLVCRLYPLGRQLTSEGEESFTHVAPHPFSRGELTREGTIAAWLNNQGAEPFIRAADAYLVWLNAALEVVPEATDQVRAKESSTSPAGVIDILDMDAVIAAFGAGPAPDDLEARRERHLEILYRQLSPEREERA